MADTLTLAYRHAGNELSTGAFYLLTPQGDAGDVLERFEKLPYVEMMRRFAGHLIKHPDIDGAIQRTDRPGLALLRLPPDEVELFRRDPVEAIRQRIFAPQTVNVGIDKKKPVEPALEAGYTTLVQHFGDMVFCRVRHFEEREEMFKHEVECPGCGKWEPFELNEKKTKGRLECSHCHTFIDLDDAGENKNYAGIKVPSLFGSKLQRFFLPRRWNKNGNWISRDNLRELHNKYMKEKAS